LTVSDETRSALPIRRWLEAAEIRRSRRRYLDDPISGPSAHSLDDFCHDFTPFEGARTILVWEAPPRIFSSIVLGYGRVSSPSALVFVGDRRRPEAAAATGYTAEAASWSYGTGFRYLLDRRRSAPRRGGVVAASATA